MPLNLLKRYSDLLELAHLNHVQRKASLEGVFKRDIEDNVHFSFRTKQIRPIKKEDGISSLETLFHHLTTREEEGKTGTHARVFDMPRSIRLHWIRYHIEELKAENVDVFSCEERLAGKDRIRTYIFDIEQDYVVVLEPQKSKLDYYLLTAYHITEEWGKKHLKKKQKNRLLEVY